MNERLRAFYRMVTEDLALQGELNEVAESVELSRDEAVSRRNMANALVDFARAHGLEIAVEDFLGLAARAEGALSDDELVGVAGGVGEAGALTGADLIESILKSAQMHIATDGVAPTELWRA